MRTNDDEPKAYRDSNGEPVTLAVLCMREPEWAASRIRELQRELEKRIHAERPVLMVPTTASNTDKRLQAVRELLEKNGCDCPCDHHQDEHDPDCEICVACRIGQAVGK